jgi:hypothetical protein
MKIVCLTCGKQAISNMPLAGKINKSPYATTLEGARAGFRSGECFCGYCALEMDENGLFPEEADQAWTQYEPP